MTRLLLLGLATAACVAPSDVDTGEASAPIINGTTASTFQTQRAVKIPGCTATRISARFAVTAAHCMTAVGDTVSFYSTPTTPGPSTGTVAQVILRPGVSASACFNNGDCDDSSGLFADIALLRLNASAGSDNALTGMQATLAWAYPGEDVGGQKVGAGQHDGNLNPSSILLQASDTTDSSSDSDGEFYTTLDQVNPGDSGGPFYVSGRVLGTLYGWGWDPAAGYFNNYTSVPRHLDWILSNIGYRWSGQPAQSNTAFTGTFGEQLFNVTEKRCQYACEKTSTCEAYEYHAGASLCLLVTGVTGSATTAGWKAALRHGASSGRSNVVAGYVRSDGVNAVVHRAMTGDANGDVHELRLGANWIGGTLSSVVPIIQLSPARRSDGVNSVVYKASGGHVMELALEGGVWNTYDLTSLYGGPNASGDPTAYVRSDGVNAIVYRGGADAHIHELRLGTSGWITQDLTAAAGSAAAASSNPSPYTTTDGLSCVVFRRGADILMLYKAPGGAWVIGGPSQLAGSPAAASRPSGYTRSNGSNAIVYRSTSGHIIELLLTGTTWSWGDLSAISGNTSTAVGDPTAYVRSDGVESVVFRTSTGALNELTLNGTWQSWNLTAVTGGPTTTWDPSAYVRSDGVNAVVYHDANNHIIELSLPPGGTWSDGDLTNISGETP